MSAVSTAIQSASRITGKSRIRRRLERCEPRTFEALTGTPFGIKRTSWRSACTSGVSITASRATGNAVQNGEITAVYPTAVRTKTEILSRFEVRAVPKIVAPKRTAAIAAA